MSLREIPETEAGHNDFAQRYFEQQRSQWEAEQRAEDQQSTTITEEKSKGKIIP
jgi:hypothetical protein